ncbi:PQQ-dependent sugar dehydrogenase [Gryllotalpicola ginsengisoli]|uniref:PQQ-dependent sugar dehydrogenase n=1 Tax=Gryllotalpicola ginsengisoli TaxID=444608 RepID=UPI0003B3E436|nr:PQQ-dependent sugar dehydrogenase [Gryllotalpicola ginsengisoli]
MLRTTRRVSAAVAASLALALLLAGCYHRDSAGPTTSLSAVPSASGSAAASATSSPSASSSGSARATPTPTASAETTGHWVLAGEPRTLETGLEGPWSIARLPDGTTLISERDSGRILERTTDGAMRTVGTVPGVVHDVEGGLLGLALLPGNPRVLYAYETTADDNRVVRMALTGPTGALALGAAHPIVTGLPHAANHNGGRLAFGPDGMLYITVGDASDPERAQDVDYLGGKLLRVTPTGAVPAGNPFPGSPVWTLGHRNPQGLGWQPDGTMWAAEFGQDTWDELNRITKGANYGWPLVEGIGHRQGLTDPVLQWSTDEASPSAIAVVGDTVFMAGLGGQRLWVVQLGAGGTTAKASAQLVGTLGRIRDVKLVAPCTLWLLTNNTDGRGSPRAGDDRLVEVKITRSG